MAKEISRRRFSLGPLLPEYRRERVVLPTVSERAALSADELLMAPDEVRTGALQAFAERQLPVNYHTGVFERHPHSSVTRSLICSSVMSSARTTGPLCYTGSSLFCSRSWPRILVTPCLIYSTR